MRVAPIGLAMGDASFAYELGCDAAAITHGHPSGYIAAGAFACLISRLTQAVPLDAAVQSLEEVLRAERNSEEVRDAIFRAYEAARRNPGRLDVLETLGEGWVAEEAFAISLYCVLSATNLEEAIVLAVNHGGDSDSTGSIAGNILGVVQGKEAIPSRWLEALELRDEIESMAGDLWDHFHNPSFRLTDADLERYPPN